MPIRESRKVRCQNLVYISIDGAKTIGYCASVAKIN